MEKLDENHLVVVHLDTWDNTTLSTWGSKTGKVERELGGAARYASDTYAFA